jgi:hypothetical protein
MYVWIAVSAAFTIDFMKGSVGFSNVKEKLTLIPSMRMLSATISASTKFLPVPG